MYSKQIQNEFASLTEIYTPFYNVKFRSNLYSYNNNITLHLSYFSIISIPSSVKKKLNLVKTYNKVETNPEQVEATQSS